jgi:hypothetical protein
MAGGKQPVGYFCVTIRTRELEGGGFIAHQVQPFEPVKNRCDRGFGGAGAVGILNPQQVFAAMMAREQPVEQRCARTADVEKAGGRRGKPRDHAATACRCRGYARACH